MQGIGVGNDRRGVLGIVPGAVRCGFLSGQIRGKVKGNIPLRGHRADFPRRCQREHRPPIELIRVSIIVYRRIGSMAPHAPGELQQERQRRRHYRKGKHRRQYTAPMTAPVFAGRFRCGLHQLLPNFSDGLHHPLGFLPLSHSVTPCCSRYAFSLPRMRLSRWDSSALGRPKAWDSSTRLSPYQYRRTNIRLDNSGS